MDTIIFSLEELQRLNKQQLIVLAHYYDLPKTGTRETLIRRIDRLAKEMRKEVYGGVPFENTVDDQDLGQKLLPDETPDNPRYSTRIRRIYWSQHKE